MDEMLRDVYWPTADNPDPTNYHIFNHLINGDGLRWPRRTVSVLPPRRLGDGVISRFLAAIIGRKRRSHI